MRTSIFFLFILILLLLWNIILYFTNEEYRFFVEKIKHQNEVVESRNIVIDDSVLLQNERNTLNWASGNSLSEESVSLSALEFLESITSRRENNQIDTRKLELLPSEINIELLLYFEEFDLESINPENYLFWVTSEYPDPFLQWFSDRIIFYSFPTKVYRDIYDIFDVLSFDLPISLNEINNFWSQSFFINMDQDWEDDFIRIVFEYQNEVFWLKIKNIYYNEVREILSVLR